MDITKKLYHLLVGDVLADNSSNTGSKRHEELKQWYPGYREIRDRVLAMQYLLADGYKLDPKRDKPFLDEIIGKHDNWVSRGGDHKNAILSDEVFLKLINTEIFLKKLSRMIECPNLENFKEFGECWRERGGGNFRHRINRTFAACTYDVSSTTSATRFVTAFDLFNNYKLITPYDLPIADAETMYEHQWHVENIYLMKELRRIFQTELINGDIDLAKLSIFVWEVYDNRNELPNLLG